MARSLLVLVLLSVTAAGCSSGGPNAANTATCSPSGTALSLDAHNVAYSTDCLAANANVPFTITFDNKDDGVPHNVDILSKGRSLFKGQIITGSNTVTYHVPALKPGTYEFRCDVHPDSMNGTFIVK